MLHYDPKTGNFRWKIRPSNNIQIGNIAGCITNKGYRQIYINNKPHTASKLAWLYMEGYYPENLIDHKDRIKDNDKWNNLRCVSHSCNMRNKFLSKNNISGIKGVCKFNGKWFAYINNLNKQISLGSFITKVKAVKARYKAEVKYDYPKCDNDSSAYNYLSERNLL